MSFIKRIPAEEGSMTAILRPYPELAAPVSTMTEYLMRSEDVQFSLAERELIATYVSDLNACTYAARTHQQTAEALGVDKSVFAALLEDIETSGVEDKLKAVLKYVKKLTLCPAAIKQADVDAVFSAGWDEKSFHFAVMICGIFNLYNRMLQGYGVVNNAAAWQKAGRGIAGAGYMHVVEQALKEQQERHSS